MLESELVCIGKVMGTFGYKGMLKVFPVTDFPERFKMLNKVWLISGQVIKEAKVEERKPHNELYLLKLKGIDSKEAAQEYKNALLMVHESEVYKLPEGYYYHFQLKGLQVFDMQRGYLGILQEVLETGANDVYIIESEKYGEILIPAIKQVIKEINLAQNSMQVELLPGLVDDIN